MRAGSDSGRTEVEVKLFGAMRDLAGRSELRLTIPRTATVAVLLSVMERQSPKLMERLKPGIYRGYISILVDGRRIRSESDLETPLADGSVVSFLPPIAGG